MAANIKFKRTSTTTLPTGLTFAEPAFVLGSAGTTTANQLYVGDNSGGRVWIGAKIENTVTGWTATEANTLLATQAAIDARITSRISTSGGFTFAATSGTPQTLTPGDTITIAAGSGISTTAGATDTVTIANTGVLTFNGSAGAVTGVSSNIAGTAISVSGATGNVTITNTGVQSLTLTQGSGISLTGSGTTGALSYTIANAGVTGIQAGTGISVSSATGFPTITNTGVIAFNGSTGSVTGVGSAVAGTGISVSGATGTVTFTNTGVQSAVAGSGISVSGATGAVTFTNTGVTGIQAGTAISVSSSTGNVTVTNTGVQSIAGTTNQITASGSTGAVTLSLPSAVTMPGSLTVTGNLTVNGTTTTVNSTTVTVQDPIISIGGLTGNIPPVSGDTKDRGILAQYRNAADTGGLTGFFGIDQSSGYFTFIPNATVASEVVSGTPGTISVSTVSGPVPGYAQLELSGTDDTFTLSGGSTNSKLLFTEAVAGITGAVTVGALSVSRTYTLPDASGTVLVYGASGNTNQITSVGTITSGTWNGATLGLAYGGTNKSLTAVNGGIVWSDADSLEISAAGTSGQILKSNGAAAPTWQDPTASGFTAYAATYASNIVTAEGSGTYYLAMASAVSTTGTGLFLDTAATALSYSTSTGTLTCTAVDALIDGGAY